MGNRPKEPVKGCWLNFYKHHLGDYDGATAHLSWEEDLAYTRLLRAYYRREKPLPLNPSETYRLVRATSAAQKKAVSTVLQEFFSEQEDGWHNKRADEEIEAYQAQASTNRRIARERTVQRTVPRIVHLQQETKRTPNQEPLTTNQEPEEEKNTVGQKPDANAQAREILNFLNSKTGRGYEPVRANLEMIAARLKEFPFDDLRAVVAKKCRDWGADEKMAPYLRPATLFNRTKFAQYQGELYATAPEPKVAMP